MIVTRTPLCVSFAGDSTDLPGYYRKYGGAVVSAGIDKYVYICLNHKFDNRIRVSYSQTEIVEEVKELQHDIVRECMKLVGVTGGVEFVSMADIPSGTGLGSSGSFTVGVLHALHSYCGQRLSAEELARQACQVEIDVLKHPTGVLEPYAAAYGGMNHFRFMADGTVERRQIVLTDAGVREMNRKLLLFYIGDKGDPDIILMKLKRSIPAKAAVLDLMKGQAERMYRELPGCGFSDGFGRELHQCWEYKKTLVRGISSGEINGYYEKALAAGASGGRLLGTGGGNFFLFYCDEDRQAAVEKAVGLQRVDFCISLHGSQVVFFA